MSLLATRMQNLRAESSLDQWTLRPSRYGALDFAIQETNRPGGLISPELLERARTSIGFTLQVPVFDEQTVSISNTRSVTVADSENDSALYNLTFVTYSWGFTQVPTDFHNNEIGAQADFNRKFNKYLYKFLATLDSAAIAALEAGKTKVIANNLGYTVTADVVSATLAQKSEVIGSIDSMMESNDFYNPLHIIGETGTANTIRQLSEKGLMNSENKTIQYADKTLHWTNRIANASGKGSTFYAAAEGSLGMVDRFEREALYQTPTPTGHVWDIETLPMGNIQVGTYFYTGVGDQSALTGAASADNTRAVKNHFGFSVDVAFMTPYTSDADTYASPIIKVDIASS